MKKVWYIAAMLTVMSVAMLCVSQEAGLASTKTPPVKIGFIGDSITHGTGNYRNAVDAEIAALGSGYRGINRGVSGSTTQDWQPGTAMFDDALADFKAQNVQIVSIMLGTNDARKISPEMYQRNLETIISKLRSTGTVRQILLNYPPYAVKPGSAEYLQRLNAYKDKIDDLVRGKIALRGDTYAYDYFKSHQSELADGIHPNKEGYGHLGQLWAAAYQRIMQDHALSLLFGTTPTRL